MNAADFDELSEAEKKHFYRCSRCEEMVDKRQLDDVLFHEDHVHRHSEMRVRRHGGRCSSVFRDSTSSQLSFFSLSGSTAQSNPSNQMMQPTRWPGTMTSSQHVLRSSPWR